MHQCPICPKSFPALSKLQRHHVIHTGQKPFVCKDCGKAFTQSVHLKTHMEKIHHSRLPRDSFQDSTSTNNKRVSQLNHDTPTAVMNLNDSGSCTIMPSAVSSSAATQPPQNMPHGSVMNSDSDVMDTKHQEQVDSAYSDTSVCNAHCGYTCKFCLKSFTSSLQLWIHSSTHTKPKQRQRGISGQTLSKKAHSKMSQELSSSLKHQCPKCPKTFCSPSKLQRHLLIHTGLKPYSCVICRKAFRQKVHLKTHLSTSNKCSLSASNAGKKQKLCNGSQTSDWQLQSSVQRPTSHQCPVNSAVELELQCRINVNAVQAPSKAEIKLDAVEEPEQPLNTSSQSIYQSSSEHEQQYMTHKDLKPFRCMICNRSFRLEINLVRHNKIHRNQKELAAPADAIKHSPEASNADPTDLNIIIKPETWSENLSDLNESPPQDAELFAPTEQQSETCQASSKNQRTNTSHKCHACSKCFPSSSKLQRHMMTHTGQRPFGCEMCGKRFRQKTHLRVHSRTHLWSRYHKQRSLYINRPPSRIGGFNTRTAGDIPIQEMFTHKGDFETHNGSDLISTKQLDQTPSMAIVQTHVNTEQEDKVLLHTSNNNEVVYPSTVPTVLPSANNGHPPKIMPHVNDSYVMNSDSDFMDTKHQEQVDSANTATSICNNHSGYNCKVCLKSFTSSPQLWIHSSTHTKPKQRQRGISGQTLSRKAHSKVSQELSSSGGKITFKHQCPKCPKTFCTPSKLQRHLLIHTGLKPYSCVICRKAFRQKVHLKTHLSTSNKCSLSASNAGKKQKLCNSSQPSDRQLQSSVQRPTSHQCPVNSAVELELQCRINVNAVQAPSKAEINLDAVEEPEQPLNASSQSIYQSSSEHEQQYMTHKDLKPFRCMICNRSFRLEINLIRHHKIHKNQKELAAPAQDLRDNVKMSHSDAIKHSPEASNADLTDLNIIIKPETWSENLSDLNESPPQDAELFAPTEQQSETCQASSKNQRTNTSHHCHACLKCFPSSSKLQRHMMTHTGQRPFGCEMCGKRFRQKTHLRVHSRTHLWSRYHKQRSLYINRPPSRIGGFNTRTAGDIPIQEMFTHKGDFETHNGSDLISTKQLDQTPSMAIVQTHVNTEQEDKVLLHTSNNNEVVYPSTVPTVLPSANNGHPPKIMPHVNDSYVMNSDSDFMDTKHQEQVDSANTATSICNNHSGYNCKVCLKSFTSSPQLWIHSSTHTKPKQRQRGISGQTLSRKAHSKVSQELSSSGGKITFKHQCPKCPKTFCTPSKLQRHLLIHTGLKPYSCVICRKAFRQKVHLKTHLSTSNKCSLSASNAGKKQKLCNSSQTSDRQLQSSVQRPTSHQCPVNSAVELELQCRINVNAVQAPSKAEIKLDAVEEPEQPLNTSSQSIYQSSGEHEQQYMTHEDLKPFRCMICNRSFRLEINLIRHHKIHRNQKELAAPAQDLRNIVKMSHSDAIKHSPEASNADPTDLNIIIKPETWSENLSDLNESPPQDAELIAPTEQQSETCQASSKNQRINTSHPCHACSKCFPSSSKLQRHMMTHTGQRPFGCEMCGKKFRQKTHLRVHSRTHLWSRYHKQRSLYINRPPSRIGGFNTRTAGDIPIQEMFTHKGDFETHNESDLISTKQLDQTPSMAIVQAHVNTEQTGQQDKVLLHTSKNNEVYLSKVPKVKGVKKTQTAKSKQNTGNVQHKCFQCFKCFPTVSKLQRHEMVHTGLKPFQCHTCGKAFRQASHLKTHQVPHYKSKASKPVNQQGDSRKCKANSQQELYPKFNVCIPPQKKTVTINTAHSVIDGAVSNVESELTFTMQEISITKGNRIITKITKSNVSCKKRKLHICRICLKNFSSPYKLSRHLVIHSGIRPYKCPLCSKTFTQNNHLKVHERRCRHGNRTSDYYQGEMINTNHLQDKCTEKITDYADLNVDASGEQAESDYTSVGHYSLTDREFSDCTEAIDSEWLVVPEVGLPDTNNESDEKQRENYSEVTDHCSYSFPSELAFEIDKLVQDQIMAPLSNNVKIPGQLKGALTKSDSNTQLSDGCASSVADIQNQTDLPDYYWCEPLTMIEQDEETASLQGKKDPQEYYTSVQPKTSSTQKHRCDICFKYFVSPSKLKRHYLVHTGQRPFRCDICGKSFTQSSHVTTHRLTHLH